MARLPGDRFLIQQIGEDVILFEDGTEREIVRFNPADAQAAGRAQLAIIAADGLTAEEKGFAHFWAGYFYAHAPHGGPTYTVTTVQADEDML